MPELELESAPERSSRSSRLRERRREEILDAAEGLVSKGGLEGLTVAALEGRLDFTRGVITYHFQGKEEIVFALLERAVTRIDRRADRSVKKSVQGKDRLTAAVQAMVDGFLSEEAACAILFAFWSRLRHDPAVAELNARLYAGYRERAERLLAELSPRLPTRRRKALAALLVGQVIGIVTQATFEPGAVDVGAAVREAGAALAATI